MNYLKLNNEKLSEIIQIFKKFTQAYLYLDNDDASPIQLKINHTKRVAENIRAITATENLQDQEINFACLLGWLHDMGRFEQWKIYQTFVDSKSESHAAISIRLLKSAGIFNLLGNNEQEVITKSILNHNQPFIAANGTEQINFYSRLLRDADKLDIYFITVEKGMLFLPQKEQLPSTYQVSDQILQAFNENKIVTIDLVHEPFDIYLFRLSWIFDITFSYVFNEMKRHKITQRLLKALPHSEKKEIITEITHNFLATK